MLRPVLCVSVLVCLCGCSRLSNHPIVEIARVEVSRNPRAAELLGNSITFSKTITGRANETDGIAAMQFQASGSKNSAMIFVEGKKLRDEWGVTLLELRPDTGNKVSLTADLAEQMGLDTPKFDPNAAPTTSSAAPPPSDIEITIPSGGPGS